MTLAGLLVVVEAVVKEGLIEWLAGELGAVQVQVAVVPVPMLNRAAAEARTGRFPSVLRQGWQRGLGTHSA